MWLIDRAGNFSIFLHQHLSYDISRRVLIVGALVRMRWVLNSHKLRLFRSVNLSSVRAAERMWASTSCWLWFSIGLKVLTMTSSTVAVSCQGCSVAHRANLLLVGHWWSIRDRFRIKAGCSINCLLLYLQLDFLIYDVIIDQIIIIIVVQVIMEVYILLILIVIVHIIIVSIHSSIRRWLAFFFTTVVAIMQCTVHVWHILRSILESVRNGWLAMCPLPRFLLNFFSLVAALGSRPR